ncbi:MAG: STAS domain-containing protein [Gammaproteobacteria bacterium]|nr:STAS domain-containing protein [Gammaproteobacteria bacterium]
MSKTKQDNTLQLDSKLSIHNIAELKSSLDEKTVNEGDVVLDGSQVQAVDTAALQLMSAFALVMREQARPLRWVDPSTTILDAAKLTGLHKALNLSP